MKVIWRMEVITIKDTGNEAMMPAPEDRSPASTDVSKKRPAMSSVNQPSDHAARVGCILFFHHQEHDRGNGKQRQQDR